MNARARVLILVVVAACGGDDLGECDQEAAEQYVFGRGGLVATKGQALMHDSCGQAVFCHSAGASAGMRMGAPAGLDFDMLPQPTGWATVVERREEIWSAVLDGTMPPDGHAGGDGDWAFAVEREDGTPRLAALHTDEGKGALRNWLACSAPIVAETQQPDWVDPEPKAGPDERAVEWTQLHGEIRQSCVAGACHDAATVQQLGVSGQGLPFDTDECVVYRWLLWDGAGNCEQPFVIAGLPDESSLVWKLEGDSRSCGSPMPPNAEMNEPLVQKVRDWIERGAYAPQCGTWSEGVQRNHVAVGSGNDAGVDEPATPTWTRIHEQVIVPRCAFSGCHVGASAAMSGELDLETLCGARDALLDTGACGEPRVEPGDADSLLLDKLENASPRCGKPMPPPAGGLSASGVDLLRAWVLDGAEAPECE